MCIWDACRKWQNRKPSIIKCGVDARVTCSLFEILFHEIHRLKVYRAIKPFWRLESHPNVHFASYLSSYFLTHSFIFLISTWINLPMTFLFVLFVFAVISRHATSLHASSRPPHPLPSLSSRPVTPYPLSTAWEWKQQNCVFLCLLC